MAAFNQLPTEILCLIVEQLDLQSDRLHLISSSRKMYNTLLPTLYSRVRLYYGDHNIESLAPFVNTILRNPTLAKTVQHLDLTAWAFDPWDTDPEAHFEYKDYDTNLIEKTDCGLRYSAEEREFQIQDLRKGWTDAWLALLLPQLSNLKRIALNWPYEENKVDKMFSRAAEDHGRLFPFLEEAFAGHCDTEGCVDASRMEPFFKFPAMRILCGSMIADCYDETVPRTQIQPCSGIEHIDLSMTNTVHGLHVWIQSCIALKSFRLDIGGATVSESELQSHRLRESLSYHKATLEKLWFRTDEESDPDMDEGWIGSFADFLAMKVLIISFAKLVDFQKAESTTTRDLVPLLPPSLETLYLCDCDYEVTNLALEQVEALLDSPRLPKLTLLGLECSRSLEAVRNRLDLIAARCEEKGITFVNFPPCQPETWDYLETIWPRRYCVN
jgi:hypothetical protein